jgi:hypothetical protein
MEATRRRFTELVALLDQRGIELSAGVDRLYLGIPPGVQTEDIGDDLVFYKQALLDLARQRT